MDKKYWRETLENYTEKSAYIASRQLILTFIPYLFLWYVYIEFLEYSIFLFIPISILMALLVLRFFVLMHDCGHGCFFSSNRANKIVGYFLGVITGMPQYVWSKNHAYHHITNGDWEKYQGPLSTITTEKFSSLSEKDKGIYQFFRKPWFALIAGFYYVLFNPRFTWLVGSLTLIFKITLKFATGSFSEARETAKNWESKYWKTKKEYRHMTYNNLTLLPLWFVMCSFIGAGNFFLVYALSLAISGGLGIIFFTVQHNFEKSYATNTANVDYFKAALEGTSCLDLPSWLNWCTADIAYHHVHHLSTSVPNYRLAACHKDLEDIFTDVRHIGLGELSHSLKYILWDSEKEIIVSVDDYYKGLPAKNLS